MKSFQKYVSIIGICCCLMVTTYAKEPSSHIFPSYTGIEGVIDATNVNIRKYPDKQAAIIKQVSKTKLSVMGQNKDWYKVSIQGKEGWIAKSLIQVAYAAYVPYSRVLGEEIVDYGKQFIGTPYVWGGNDLNRGVDCSGLTKQIYDTFDITLSRISYLQAQQGKKIKKSQLVPGDLVFFDTTGNNTGQVSHVGIYAGNNRFLHADGDKGVMISSLNSPYYTRNYVTSRRILSF